jgi:hypothetical protein
MVVRHGMWWCAHALAALASGTIGGAVESSHAGRIVTRAPQIATRLVSGATLGPAGPTAVVT